MSLMLYACDPPRADQVVMHLCNNRACVNPGHLRAGTQMENIHQSVREGRMRHSNHARGEASGTSKLSNAQAIAVRCRIANGETRADIARDFGVSWGTVDQIHKNKTWKHVA